MLRRCLRVLLRSLQRRSVLRLLLLPPLLLRLLRWLRLPLVRPSLLPLHGGSVLLLLLLLRWLLESRLPCAGCCAC